MPSIHKPIQIKNLAFALPHKTCFDNFNVQIPYGSRIAIIGRNGCGKTTLLEILHGMEEPTTGSVSRADDVIIGFVPQIIEEFDCLSGGQRLNAELTQALNLNPNVLLLDEPTNHLDKHNRKSLVRMLQNYPGTLIIVSHDKDLLRYCVDTLWHIDDGKVSIFLGNYDDYMREIWLKRTAIESELEFLKRQKKDMHYKLIKEQQRAAKSKAKGEKKVENRKWLKIVGNLKGMKAEKCQGKKLRNIDEIKNKLNNKLTDLRIPEIITPRFYIDTSGVNKGVIVQISLASIGYSENRPILSGISLSLESGERIAITGDNGSGKSTLIKAILGDESVYRAGEWYVVKRDNIGYLDQHYSTLNHDKTVLEIISDLGLHWSHSEIRRHLNNFLFRKNEEVIALVNTLSGGEKVRLSLAQIVAKTPELLIIDEITNNLDLETKEHVIQVLKVYQGGMIVISHDTDFLEEIGVNEIVDIQKFKID